MSVQQELFVNAVIAAGGTIYSQPVDLGGNSNVFVGVTTVVGSAALDATTGLEGSSDLTNWGRLPSRPRSLSAPPRPSRSPRTPTWVPAMCA